MKRISLCFVIGLMLSVCQGQTLESLRASYSNDMARIEVKMADFMKDVQIEYSMGLEKVHEVYVKNVNVRGIKAVANAKKEFLMDGNIALDGDFPEIAGVGKKYRDSESNAENGAKTLRKGVLEKYRIALKNLCSVYVKSDMEKAEKVNNEMEMVDSLLKEYVSVDEVDVLKTDKKTDEKELIGNAKNLVGRWKRQSFPIAYYTILKNGRLSIESNLAHGLGGSWSVEGYQITFKLDNGIVRIYRFDSSKSFSGKNAGLPKETFIKEQ